MENIKFGEHFNTSLLKEGSNFFRRGSEKKHLLCQKKGDKSLEEKSRVELVEKHS